MEAVLGIDKCSCGGEHKYIGDTYIEKKLYDVYECENCYKVKNIKNRDNS